MRIKHWQGYGTVTAKKLSCTTLDSPDEESLKLLKIKVQGNHEWGLERNDRYDLFNWLVKKFDKKVKDEQDVIQYDYEDGYEDVNGEDTEYCIYSFIVRETA